MNPLFLLFGLLGGIAGLGGIGGSDDDAPAPTTPGSTPPPTPGDIGSTPTPPAANSAEVGVYLVNTSTDTLIMELTDGAQLTSDVINAPNLSVVVVPKNGADIGSVTFNYENGAEVRTESFSPYALFGDVTGGDIQEPDAAMFDGAGSYSLDLEIFSGRDGKGTLLNSQSISLLVAEPTDEPDNSEDTTGGTTGDTTDTDNTDTGNTGGNTDTGNTDSGNTGGNTDTGDTDSGNTGGNTDTGNGNTGGNTDVDTPDQPGDSGDGGAIDPIAIGGTVDVIGGRVATLAAPEGDIAGIEILSGPDHGKVTVNPDNSFALVLTGETATGRDDFTYKITYDNGTTSTETINLNVSKGAQAAGWATGESHYLLATDDDDNIVVETGENHVKVHISGANSALSLDDIARTEGVSKGAIDGKFLAQKGYGQTEQLALDQEAGKMLWNHVTPKDSSTSNWLLLERGHDYGDLGRLLNSGADGEDELHPLYLGAYGEGDRPVITTKFFQYQDGSTNVVTQGIEFHGGITNLSGGNVIYDDLAVQHGDVVFQNLDGLTFRNSSVTDVHHNSPENGRTWGGSEDRISGLFGNDNDGILLESNFFDLNGFELGYDPGDSAGADSPQPPSMFNHNIYLGARNTDVTIRDVISARAASIGIMNRPGGFMEDNVMIDNNIGMNTLGGDYRGAGPVGNYTLVADSLITSAGHRSAEYTAGRPLGLEDKGKLSSLVDNIVTHLGDPNDPNGLDGKIYTQEGAVSRYDEFYDDTIVHNWVGQNPKDTERNTEGLDKDVLDATTIQNLAAQILGSGKGTIEDFLDYLRDQADGAFDDGVDADFILKYFQDGFGVSDEARSGADTLRFVPDELADGVRWDNRLNWDSEDLPGLFAEDDVDLGGNNVVYASTTTIDELDMGPGGALSVYGGKLTLNGGITGDDSGALNVTKAGQVWTDGVSADDLDVSVEGGRFVNTGKLDNTSLTASDGETVLATGGAEFHLGAGETLSVESDAKVGFDGNDGGLAILDLDDQSTLEFSAKDGGLATIEEFRTGALGDSPDVQSGANLGNATLSIDLAGMSARDGGMFDLLDVDELTGVFDEAIVGGLGNQNATIVVDYEQDKVTLELSSGNGQVTIQKVGAENDVTSGEQALWNALTDGQGVASDEQPANEEQDELDMAI